ncbi:hypothetical protein [Streptosporangium sp. V21-05]|uniref:hypothetical protein n=1 Tax=Streptosporangium sp. V21-05 TaxID=3446115 RepID=UPI003F53E537
MAEPADIPAAWVDAVYPITLKHGIPWHDDAIRIMLAAALPTIAEQVRAEERARIVADVADAVYIAEVIWFSDNPVDGRKRIAVSASLDAALNILRGHDIHGGDLVATETPSALGTKSARTWAVHERGEEPDDEGHLWITEEPVIGGSSRG